MSDPMCDKCADRGCAKCEPEITLARLAEREERTADTLVSLTPAQATVICPRCGTRLTAIGVDPRIAAMSAGDVHDIECAHLKAAAALLDPPDDDEDALRAAEAEVVRLTESGSDRITLASASASIALAAHTADAMDAILSGRPFGGDAA